MKKIVLGTLFIGLATSCIGSSIINGNNKIAKGEFSINPNYTELKVTSGIKVILDPTIENGEGRIVADEKVIDYVSITEKNGKVVVSYDPHISVKSKIETIVTIPASRAITALRASSAGSILAQTQILAHSLYVKSSSAAKIDIRVEARDLKVEVDSAADCYIEGHGGVFNISGDSAAKFKGKLTVRECYVDLDSASKCIIEGTADYCRVEVDSAASFDGYDFICKKADLEADSAGSIKITVTEELGANVSSGASVKYKGTPRLTAHDVSSGGSLKKAD